LDPSGGAADIFFRRHRALYYHLAIGRELVGILEPLQFPSSENHGLHGWHVIDGDNLSWLASISSLAINERSIANYCGNESVEPTLGRKKNQKKTCQTLTLSAKGKLRSDKCPHFVVQKNSKKVKKKLVRALEI
jgi:hypothetical protein